MKKSMLYPLIIIFLFPFLFLAEAASAFTLYYKGAFNPPYAHYQLDGGEWTSIPGQQMLRAGNGYYKITIEAGSAKGLQVAFNNGNGKWDSRNGNNHFVAIRGNAATYTEPGKITNGAPSGIQSTGTSTSNKRVTVSVYYPSEWTSAYIHYGINGKWTKVPGYPMKKDAKSGAFKANLSVPISSSLEVVFNNGGSEWDNNNRSNYKVNPSAGTVNVANGQVKKGAPTGTSTVKTVAKTSSKTSSKTTATPSQTLRANKPFQPVAIPANGNTNFSWDNATVYFVLTDRFHNGNPSNDESYGRKKRDANGKNIGTFHGGDLSGLTQKLEQGYFRNLGVNAIWITAPYEQAHGWVGGGKDGDFAHYPYHGYYALDFTGVDKNMGTVNDMRTFVDTAHKQGIRVILDIVMNHVGYATMRDMEDYGFAKRSGVSSSWTPASGQSYHSYHDQVNYKDEEAWSRWWGKWVRSGISGYTPCGNDDRTMCLAGLPDLRTDLTSNVGIPPILKTKWSKEKQGFENWIVPAAKSLRTDLGGSPTDHIVSWLSAWVREFGIDGFRVDTAKHVELSRWKQLKEASDRALRTWRKANPGKAGASWTDSFWMVGEVWGHGVGKSEYFNNGFDAVINFDFQKSDVNNLEGIYAGYAGALNTDPSFNVLSYLSSHDTQLYERGKLIQAGTALLLAPGAIQIYYGDETARPFGDTGSDKDQGTRSSMNWGAIDKDVYAHWQTIGRFRNRHVAIGAGQHQKMNETPYTFARTYEKNGKRDAVIVVVGASGTTNVKVGEVFANATKVRDGYTGKTATVVNGKVSFVAGTQGVILIERSE